jgi:hypothetical protein
MNVFKAMKGLWRTQLQRMCEDSLEPSWKAGQEVRVVYVSAEPVSTHHHSGGRSRFPGFPLFVPTFLVIKVTCQGVSRN